MKQSTKVGDTLQYHLNLLSPNAWESRTHGKRSVSVRPMPKQTFLRDPKPSSINLQPKAKNCVFLICACADVR